MEILTKEFLECMENIPCLRSPRELCGNDTPVICHLSELGLAVAHFKAKFRVLPPLYVLGAEDLPDFAGISALPVSQLPDHCEPHVFFKPAKAPIMTCFVVISGWLREHGFERYTLEPQSVADFWGAGRQIVFSADDLDKASRIYSHLADEASKKTYMAAIKARMSGNAGFLPWAHYPQYFHPDIHPAPNDVVCEGGIADGKTTKQLATAVAPKGHVFGFELLPSSYARSLTRLAEIPEITLLNMALWSQNGRRTFVVPNGSPGAAHLREDGDETCECIRIDDYFADKHVDCIKLDIEGAELQALTGGESLLRRCKPKLLLSIYHNQGHDLVDLPWHMLELEAGYSRCYIGHHSRWFNETILYAD